MTTRTHPQVTNSEIFGTWATTLCQRLCVPHLPLRMISSSATRDDLTQSQIFTLLPVFNHFFPYYCVVWTLQEADAKTRLDIQHIYWGNAGEGERGDSGSRQGKPVEVMWVCHWESRGES